MGIFTTILLLFIFVFVIHVDGITKKGISLYKTFIIYWMAIVFFGIFQLYGLYDISIDVYILVLEGCLAFSIGYILFKKSNKEYHKKQTAAVIKEYVSFNVFFYVALSGAVFLVLKQVLMILPIILLSGMSDARSELQMDETLTLVGGWDIILAYFAKPFIKATMIILIVNMFHYKIQMKKVILVLFLVGVYFFSEGGRAVVMDLFFSFCYLLYVNKKLLSKKSIAKIKNTIVFIAFLPVLATFERGGDVFFAIYTYYCGSLQYLSQALQFKTVYFEENLYGMACFQGFIKPITGLLQIIGIAKPQVVQDASDFIIDAQTTVYNIAPNCEMNYFYTTFGYAYKDGGYIGNFILHIIYGIICKYIDIKSFINSKTIRWVAVKTTFFYCILYTMSYYHFSMYLHAMTIIYIVVITSNIFSDKKTCMKRIS